MMQILPKDGKLTNSKIVILGDGFIGNCIADEVSNSLLLNHRIGSYDDVIRIIRRENPTHIINCIGKTGVPNVDWCEDNKKETYESNVLVPLYIAKACAKLNVKMIHLSSGCIYTSDDELIEYSEEDKHNFFGSFYSRTKIESELKLRPYNVLQLRIRMPLLDYEDSRNILTKLLKYDQIISRPNSITYIPDFIDVLKQLIEIDATGVFNVVNPGFVTNEQLLQAYNAVSSQKKKYEVIPLDEFLKIVKAERSNCLLSTRKLDQYGIKLRSIQEILPLCVANYVYISSVS